ncbi:MAG: DUF4214 domain-containing protein [Actinomycetota bacterium]
MRRLLFTVLVLGGLFPALPAGALTATEGGDDTDPTVEVSITCDGTGVHTARLYRTLFGRQADPEGLAYWVALRRAGIGGDEVASWMTQSAEYRFLYEGLDDGEFLHAVYRNLLGRDADEGGHAYWLGLIATDGRASVVSWMTQTPEFAERWPFEHTATCGKAERLGLTEIVPGISVGKRGSTVTVIADRNLVALDARDGGRTYASRIPGDVVVNANWFIGSTSQSPVVVDGQVSGSGDRLDRGQIVEYHADCETHGGRDLDHIWMGEEWTPNACVRSAVSGVSLIHKGQRSDAYPGIDITYGYTNVNRSHSFLGFNDDEIIIVSTLSMNASMLADYALGLGVEEGVMLDGGGSTQISTAGGSIGSARSVPSFAVLNSLAAG